MRILSLTLCGFLISPISDLFAQNEPLAAPQLSKQNDEASNIELRVRELLERKCFDCHGAESQESHFRLDSRRSLLSGGDSGEPAIVIGDGNNSHLVALVQGKEAGKIMPPDESDRLTAEEAKLLIDWIDQGAPWSLEAAELAKESATVEHWAFQPLRKPTPPAVEAPFVNNPIDSYILEKLKEQSIAPNPSASKGVLIRRLYLDMLGLPPTPEEVSDFETDDSEQAYANLVERVLQSPHYGERWGQYWLDLVRFAETNGFETNRERPNAWPYRDYVIRSWNDDKPYQQFVREQIAGDALGVPEATGYLVAGPYDLVKSPDPALTMMQRQNELDDIVGTTSTVFLGLTVGCARCHNHKFDPIRQTDYYALQAIFAGVQHGERKIPVNESTLRAIKEIDEQIQGVRDQLKPFLRAPQRHRPPVHPKSNVETFDPVETASLRFVIENTNAGEPCLDELEVYSDGKNVALQSQGTTATASSSLPNYPIHRLEHINDGREGNNFSWISNEPGKGWIQLDFPQAVRIDRVVWGRDREGRFADRLATQYRVEVPCDNGEWRAIASSDDRMPFPMPPINELYTQNNLTDDKGLQFEKCIRQLQELESVRDRLSSSQSVYAGIFEQPGTTHRLFRGEPTARREAVSPGTIAVLGKLPIDDATPEQARRIALADWITSPENPLMPRVIANRIWQFHFGKGLVETPNDFGKGGIEPSHPELLDYLATYLLENQGSIKELQRLILHSSTYRQSSEVQLDAIKKDAGARWLWRFPPRRLEAEAIRDSILAVTATLDRNMFGPGFSGFEVEMENVRHYFPKQRYSSTDWRRMVYMTKVRMEKESVFGAFDCPDSSISVPKRNRSTTPLQALNLFNSPFVLQQSDLFAQRLKQECGTETVAQARRAYWLCMGREPEATEVEEAAQFIDTEGLAAFCRVLLNSNEFIFIP